MELSQQDKEYLWRVVDEAVQTAGSHTNLFANRLEFFDDSGRIRFNWPSWLDGVKVYLTAKYGEDGANSMLLTILREVMAEQNYSAYLRNSNNNKFHSKQIVS